MSLPGRVSHEQDAVDAKASGFIEWQERKKDVDADVLLAELACVWLWSVTYLLTAIVVCELRGT